MILKNQLGLSGKKTNYMVMYDDFMTALFNIEKDYVKESKQENGLRTKKNERFSISKTGKSGREQLLYHVTKSDLFLATVLQLTCYPGTYNITNVTYKNLYDVLNLYYEPVMKDGKTSAALGFSDFLKSIEKLKVLGLITITKRPFAPRYDIQLNHIAEGSRRFVKVHPVIFTSKFTALSLAHWKLYFAARLQAGDNPNNFFFRNIEDSDMNDRNMRDRGLLTFLHKYQGSDIRKVVSDLINTKLIGDEPLLHPLKNSTGFMVKKGRKYIKAELKVNPYFMGSKEKQDGEKYHYIIEPELKYRRIVNAIEQQINAAKIQEYFAGRADLIRDILDQTKTKGKAVAKYVVSRIAEHIHIKGKLPYKMDEFAATHGREKTKAKFSLIVQEVGLFDQISPETKGEEFERRLQEFISSVSTKFKSITVFREVAKKIQETINKDRDPAFTEYCSLDLSKFVPYKIDLMIEEIRIRAHRELRDAAKYRMLEEQALQQLLSNVNPDRVVVTLLKETQKLPKSYFDLSQDKLEDLFHSVLTSYYA